MLSVEATGADDLPARLEASPLAVQAALRVKAADLALRLQAHVRDDKLSGQVLQARSGALKASIAAAIDLDGAVIRARVFSLDDVKYAAIQEFGGQTSPHDITPDKAKALAFMIGGRRVFANRVHHPGSHIPARSYLRSSLDDMAAQICDELRQTAVAAAAGDGG